MLRYPISSSFLWLILLSAAAAFGAWLRKTRPLTDEERQDFSTIQAATLTLLGLIIGFSFSMATSRYDLRKSYEEEEANAIGTEYSRAGLLSAADASKVRDQLAKYLPLRISFYTVRDDDALQQINDDTARLQTDMWNAVEGPAHAQQTPIVALAVSGMNDVLNSQGYAQAAAWNRIPTSAWALMIAIAACGCFLVGYGIREVSGKGRALLIAMPLVVSIALLLIADIDSPRRGLIHVVPQNLESLAHSLPQH
jgi:hypothetical protein